MDAITFVAERKIEQALQEGEFDNLPGMGKPLAMENLSHLPPELRMAYTILKNSGYIEKIPEAGKLVSTRELLRQCPDESNVYGKMQRLKVMMARVRHAQEKDNPAGRTATDGPDDAANPYLEKLVERV